MADSVIRVQVEGLEEVKRALAEYREVVTFYLEIQDWTEPLGMDVPDMTTLLALHFFVICGLPLNLADDLFIGGRAPIVTTIARPFPSEDVDIVIVMVAIFLLFVIVIRRSKLPLVITVAPTIVVPCHRRRIPS